jgi:hypothetical protein
MHKTALRLTLVALAAACAADALAQGMPTTQPKFLHIFRESVKAGRAAEHAKWEAGWPAAFEKAGSKHYYLALTSLTGPQEAWFVAPFASQAAYGEMLAVEGDPALGPELERLAKGDADFLEQMSAVQAVAVPELSHGTFPDMSKVRFYEVSTFRLKPGYYEDFATATKAYVAAAKRSAPHAAWRTYAVVAGGYSDTFLVMSSFTSFAEFDTMAAEGDATWKNATPEEQAALGKFMKEAVLSTLTQRFRVDPGMSYVDAATRAKDPAFWGVKK